MKARLVENIPPNTENQRRRIPTENPLILFRNRRDRYKYRGTEHPHHHEYPHNAFQITEIEIHRRVGVTDAEGQQHQRSHRDDQIRDYRHPVRTDPVERHNAQQHRNGQQKVNRLSVERSTDKELAVVFDKARKEVPPLHYLFTVMLYTGARMGDCATLKWEDIDLARGFMSFVPIKMKRYGNRARVKIPILPPLRAMLESYPADGREGYVMPDMAAAYEAGKLSDTITAFFRDKCNIETSVKTDPTRRARPVVGAHSFRHTFVSKAANAGIPFAIVQQIVGHQTAEMCRHYFHEDEDATLRAFAAFPVKTATQQIENRDPGDVIDVEAVETTAARPTAAERRAALEAALAEIERDGDAAERKWAAGLLAKFAKGLANK